MNNQARSRGADQARVSNTGTAFDYHGLICVWDNVVARMEPNSKATPLNVIRFGEEVARIGNQLPIQTDNSVYIQVQLTTGHLAWVNQSAFISDGKLAVLTSNVNAANSPDARSREFVNMKAGQLLVLEDVDGDFIKVAVHNSENKFWIRGTDHISIEPIDLEVAMHINQALEAPSAEERRQQLQRIRQLEGFSRSELSGLVVELLTNSYSLR